MARRFEAQRQGDHRAGVRLSAARSPAGRRALVAGGLLALVIAIGLAAGAVTSSSAVCASCHEMAGPARAWRASGHAAVACVSCHRPARAWYAAPLTLYDRAALLARDVVVHVARPRGDTVASAAVRGAMPDAVCLRCHDVDREATSGFRIRIDHPEHARRNGSCVSCHVRTAHPLPARGGPLSLMAQCFTCHGTLAEPDAGTACTLCHPQDFDLVPASHEATGWALGHGKVSMRDPKQCDMCHKRSFCLNCHGLPMPHPANWAKIGEPGHAQYAERDRVVCARCHRDKPDLCSMCHHKAWRPDRGTWVQQHFIEVEERGATYCMRCHVPVFCVRCHVSFATQD